MTPQGLERVLNHELSFLPGNLLQEASSKAYDLYRHHIRRNTLAPEDFQEYSGQLLRLSLPQKISVYLDLRNKGISCMKMNLLPQGKDCIKAAMYFLKNHVILSGYKSEAEVEFYELSDGSFK
ncbi:hypothetical protein J4234_06830 [Candidatus Woesearchaeota archaeon]|nr:hypothetical protein [Candidatus Woesearchaeota archaeon]